MAEVTEGTVIAVLSGDTILVKYPADRPISDSPESRYVVAELPIACAPALAIFVHRQENDPFAIESMEFLRRLIHGTTVVLTRQKHSVRTFTHQMLGDIPVGVFSIELADSEELIDITLISAGYARIRPIAEIPARLRIKVNHNLEDAAVKEKIGVWGEPRPRVDPMTVAQFDSVIVNLNRDFTFRLLEPPVDFELVGVIINPEREKTPEFREFFGEYVLFQKVVVRILARRLNAPWVVSMTVGGHDLSAVLLLEGFAKLNELTARHFSDIDRFKDPPMTTGTFRGRVKAVPSSSSVLVETPSGERRLFIASIRSRLFDFYSSGETLGYESWRFLRDAVLGKEVEVTILGPNLAQLSVNGQDVSEMMLRAGTAELGISRIHLRPSNLHNLIDANRLAKADHKGIYDTAPPKTPLPYRGTVAAILSPTELSIYIPSNDRFQLNTFVLVNVQAEGNDGFIILESIRLLTEHFLHREVEVPNSGIVRDLVTRADPRILLVRAGYLRVGDISERDLLNAQASAKSELLGIWRPTFARDPLQLNLPVIVTEILSPTRLFLQVFSEALRKIQNGLSKLLIKPREQIKPDVPYIMRVNSRTFRVVAIGNDTSRLFALDYGFTVPKDTGNLFECPDDLKWIPPQCICCDLAHVALFDDPVHNDWVVKTMWNIFDSGAIYQATVVRPGLLPAVILREIPDGAMLQAALLRHGAMQLDKAFPPKGAYPEGLEKLEADARRYSQGGWAEGKRGY
jgi:endonuclease YncB( thermonuclease family)